MISKNHPSVSEGAQWFRRKKRCAGDFGQVSGLFALVLGSEGLGGVFNDKEFMFWVWTTPPPLGRLS
jgi:hypothetical protein